MEYLYALPGINVDRCKFKGCKGNVFFSIDLKEFYKICHTGSKKKLGRCNKCNREKYTEFRRTLGPALVQNKYRAKKK